MCLTKILFPVFMFAFNFSLPLYYLAASISHFLTAAMKFSCFSSNEIHLPSSFSVIHVSVNIKNNVEKGSTLLFFFLSKSPSGHAIFFCCRGLPYLSIELFCITFSSSINVFILLCVIFLTYMCCP